MLRRLTEHLRIQNWAAVILELIVVVVGIFLAFQLERWYAEQRLRSNVQERLVALSAEFSKNSDELDRAVQINTEVVNATLELLKMDEQSPSSDDYDYFYQLLATASRTNTRQFQYGAYNSLISTGELELFDNESLKLNLAGFYAGLDQLSVFSAGSRTVDINTFEPFVIRNLDHVEMLHYLHSNDIRQTKPTQDSDAFLKVLGTSEFEGVISVKWHSAFAERVRMQALREQAIAIEDQLEESLQDAEE